MFVELFQHGGSAPTEYLKHLRGSGLPGVWAPGATGVGFKYDGTGAVNYGDHADWTPGARDTTVVVGGNPPSNAGASCLFSKRETSGAFNQISLWVNHDGGAGRFGTYRYGNGSSYRYGYASAGSPVDGAYHHFAATSSQTDNTIWLFRDGVSVSATKSTLGGWPAINNTFPVIVGGDGATTYVKSGTVLDFAYFWLRALGQAELEWLWAEPFGMFAPLVRRTYVVPAPAVGAYPGGIPSAEAFGVVALHNGQAVFPAGSAAETAYGVPTFAYGLHPGSVVSAQAAGAPSVWFPGRVNAAGLATAAAFGGPAVLKRGDALTSVLPSTARSPWGGALFELPPVAAPYVACPLSVAPASAFGTPQVT